MNSKVQEIAERYMVLSVALFVMAMGISFSIRAGLGITPISCPPYVFSLVPGFPTVGQCTIIMHVLFVAAQVAIRRREFPKSHYLQLVMGTIFGCFMDLTNWITSGLEATSYLMQIVFMLIGISFVAVGVVLQVTAKAMLVAGEGIMLTLANLWKVPFSKVKMGFDISLVLIGVVSSWLFFGEIRGVREGTVMAAVLVGLLAGKVQPVIGVPIGRWLDRHKHLDEVTVNAGERFNDAHNYNVITIAREFGSGGHEIGERLATKLGWTFIDQQLIDKSLEKEGLSTDYITKHDQQMTEGERLWKFICGDNFQAVEDSLSPEDQLFVAQGKVIREYAEKGNCVIVGRCANFFLQDEPQCFNVFISASLPFATRRIEEEFGYDRQKAEFEIQRRNRSRATHYSYYTGQQWGGSEYYDSCLRSSSLGIETTVNVIAEMVM